jgi:hypothetical protein
MYLCLTENPAHTLELNFVLHRLGDDTLTRPFSTHPTSFLSLIFTPPQYFVFPFII